MVSDTRSSRKINEDESNTPKKRLVNGKFSSPSGSANSDKSGLRRSTRETPSRKQVISSPSSTRKSGRLEKRITTLSVKKNHERVEKQRVPSPLRRSDRGKKQTSVSSSGSKKSEKGSGSPVMKRKKLKREFSVKKLRFEPKDMSRSKKQDLKPVGMTKKRMDGRTYKALFQQQRRRDAVQDTEVERPEKKSQVDSSNDEGSDSEELEDGEVRVNSNSKRFREELSEGRVETASEEDLERSNPSIRNVDAEISGSIGEVEISCSSPKHSCKDSNEHSDGNGLNGSKSGGLHKKALDPNGDNGLTSRDKVVPSKRKRNMVDTDSNAFARVVDKDTRVSDSDAVSSPSLGCERHDFLGDCVACSKRQRVDYDSQNQALCSCHATLNKVPSDTFIPKDRGELEPRGSAKRADNCDCDMQQKGTPLEMDNQQNTCVICKLGGTLLRCGGKDCKRSYHISCVDPPLDDVPLGVWHCLCCVKKKIKFGVHSVSDEIESVWDVREVEVSDTEGLQRQKQYLVKYKGLAHIHNHWIPETQLHSSLVAEFHQNNQATRWKKEWTMPHRLLKKRLLIPLLHHRNEMGNEGDISESHYEWLVKWRGLDYEHATWELDNASFVHLPQVHSLTKEYENRREKAKIDNLVSQVDKNDKDFPIKLSKLPAGVSSVLDNNHLPSVNKLREFWHKGHNAFVIDDQERAVKIVLFILSLLSDVSQPFLIISTSDSISLWEDEFSRLAPSINVVVYSGNKDIRRNIRTLEFYEEGGCVMFEVLISPSEAVVEDLEILDIINWEGVVVDECQRSIISTQFKQIKMLATEFWVLLFLGQIKDSITEHLNLLSLLDSRSDLDTGDGSKTDSHENISKLKRRLSRFIAYDSRSETSRFVEYWVPVWISNVQLEQYCAALLSNSFPLCSTSKVDAVGALRDILISMRKCCDHPYIVDPSLQGLITKGLPLEEYLDVGIKASGKLQLLDMMLSEIKNRQQRVVILFQTVAGSGQAFIGDILDDFIRQRFGPDSYERVDVGLIASKKQAKLNKFNNKDSGIFVFLLENRACLPSIKLSSVDAIIIFDSDWNPINDLRALQRISLESHFQQIQIFRLYSACTVEEKALILAKHDLTLDSNLLGISRSTSNALLMWGASYLFIKLDEFHGGTNISSEQSLLKDVINEFLAIVCRNVQYDKESNSLISKVQHSGGTYSGNNLLLGEQKIQLTDGEEPRVFWTKLLEGRNPRWKYSCGSSQRNRKRVQYVDHSPHNSDGGETDEIGKKRKKVIDSVKPGDGEVAGEKGGDYGIPADNGSHSLSRSTASVPHTPPFSSDNMPLLPEVHMFESEDGTLQNTQKSLHLLLKLEMSKLGEILQLSEDVKDVVEKFLEYVIHNHHVTREPATIFQAFQISLYWIAASLLKLKIDRRESLVLAKQHLNFSCKEEEVNNVYLKMRGFKKTFLSHTENLREASVPSKDSESPADQQIEDRESSRSVKHVQKRCDRRMKKLIQKQQEQIQEVFRTWEEAKVKLEKEHRLESALVRSIHSHLPVRTDKLKLLDNEFEKKLEENNCQKDRRIKDLAAKQLDERNEERRKANQWLEELKKSLAEGQISSPDRVPPSTIPDTVCSETVTTPVNTSSGKNEVQAIDPARGSVSGLDQPNEVRNCGDAPEKSVSVNQASEEQIGDAPEKPVSVNQASEEQIGDAPENLVFVNLASEELIVDGASSSMRDQEVALEMGGTFTRAVEANAEENRRDESDTPNAVPNRSDAGGSSIDGGSVSGEMSLVDWLLVQPAATPIQEGQLSQDLALRDDCLQSSTSNGMQEECAPANGNPDNSQHVEIPLLDPVDAGPTDQTNNEAITIEHVDLLQQSPSSNLPVAVGHDQMVRDPSELSNEAVSPPGPIDSSLDQPNLSSASGFNNQETSVWSTTTFQNTDASPRLVEDIAEFPIQDGLGVNPQVNIPVGGPGPDLLMHTAPQVGLRIPRYPSYSDPLQNELERLRREIDQVIKHHEETNLRLKSECDKEIEEIVAQIRRKYEAKQQDAECDFLLRKKDLDTNHNKVLMNKILAEAFRSKCLDIKTQQIVPSSFTQHLNQISAQATPRPPPSIASSSSTGPQAATQQGIVPSVQVVHHSSALFSSIPARPPHISPITPPTRNTPIREFRAPAPHIQPFRPLIPTTSQQSSANMLTTPPLVPPLSLQTPTPTPPPPPPPPATHHSALYNRTHRPEIAGGPPGFRNSSMSAMELLMDVDNRNAAHPRNNMPPLPELSPNFEALDLSQFGLPGSVAVNPINTGVGTDVVCLSDDD